MKNINQIKRLCVFCGSKTGNNLKLQSTAVELARHMAEAGIELVYGGASVGLMGILADSVLKHNGKVHGVMPTFMKELEVAHHHLTHMHWVDSMHARKRMMYDLSDAFIAMPGGFGTLDELFEILTWKQLAHHSKRIFVLNVDGYFNHLEKQVQAMVDFGFVSKEHQSYFEVISNSKALPF